MANISFRVRFYRMLHSEPDDRNSHAGINQQYGGGGKDGQLFEATKSRQ